MRRHSTADMLMTWSLMVLLFVAGSALGGSTYVPGLAGEWRAAGPDAPAAWQAFEPARLTRIERQPAGAEVRLWAEQGAASDEPWMLVVTSPGLERVQARSGTATTGVTAGVLERVRRGWQGHGRLAFELEDLPRADSPVLLHVEAQNGLNGKVAFRLLPRSQATAEDARWLALVSTCLAFLVGMALIALVFWMRLGDGTFALYAFYLLGYALIQLVQTGYVASPLEWGWIADAPRAWGRAAVGGSIALAVLFLIRFADLPRFLPGSVLPLNVYAGVVVAGSLAGYVPWAPLQAASSMVINPLIVLGGPLLLVVSLWAWLRGSRYGGFFLLGWTPLLLVTAAGSMQLLAGWWPYWYTSTESSLMAAAFEALVLSAGLADRAALAGRERDAAVALAERDALTGTLNRRAVDDRLREALDRPQHEPLSVLFADLDLFKRLNDSQGHAAGDAALVRIADELRREMRSRDVLGRYGGEEFVVLLPGLGLDAARQVAERLRGRVQALGDAGAFGGLALTLSIGVVEAGADEGSDQLLQRADRAMYQAKSDGRNRTVAG